MFASPTCKQCHQPIYGSSIQALGASWHPEHFVCARCGRPLGTGPIYEHQDLPYDHGCYMNLFARRCAYCGKPLTRWLQDQWGTIFCPEHEGQFPHCAYCGRLVSPEQQKADTGEHDRVRCPVCQASAIDTVEQARPIFNQLKQWVGRQGLQYNNLPLQLELCDRARLSRYQGSHAQPHSLGVTMLTHVSNGSHTQTEVRGVAMLQGLPSIVFQGSTIHELGHVWLAAQGIHGLQPWQEEGFCELLAHRYYRELNTEEGSYHALSIENNKDPVYGEGFRRVHAIADRVGFQRFLQELRVSRRMPAR